MGLQHYKIRLIPTEFEGVVREEGCWNERQPTEEELKEYCGILPVDRSWGEVSEFRSRKGFGSVLYVWRDDKLVRELTVEWTPSEIDVLRKVCEQARRMNCDFYSDETGRRFTASVESCLSDWKETRSAKFVANPMKALVERGGEIEGEG
ncbi:MAG: hypothetical protein CMO55_14730 [Verrucomicrobiales bacterium]|nr:hypothetical protein [Verrucomicrobiales bacterium]